MSDFRLEYPDKTLYEMVYTAARQHPDQTAYSFMGKKTTYSRLIKRIHAAAAFLWQLGIRQGDRVTICMPNTPQAVDCFYALNRIGAVANVIHPLCAQSELEFYLRISQSKAILVLDQFYHKVAQLKPDCMILVANIRQELPFFKKQFHPRTKLSGGGYIRWQGQCSGTAGLPKAAADPDACACILYSGGTTGKPKGVCLSSRNFNAAAIQTLAASDYEDVTGMKMLAVLPMFHGFGLGVGIHTPLIAGASSILVPRFRLNSYLRLIKREKPDFIPGVPSLFDAMLGAKALKHTDLGFLKGIFCGGDHLSPELKDRMDAFLRQHGCTEQIREGYGMTESVSVSCLTPRHAARAGAIGLPLPDTLYQIVTPGTTQEVPTGEPGEICISGPSVMLGYLDDREETDQALRRHSDGRIWLHTGDLGSMDPDGYVRFLQRLKRMIVTNGYNVYPTQLEEVLLRHPQVNSCCVVGIQDPQRGQRVKAFVIPTGEPSEQLRQSILDHCAKHIARYAMPKEIEFLTQFPMTPLGKVDYKALENQ